MTPKRARQISMMVLGVLSAQCGGRSVLDTAGGASSKSNGGSGAGGAVAVGGSRSRLLNSGGSTSGGGGASGSTFGIGGTATQGTSMSLGGTASETTRGSVSQNSDLALVTSSLANARYNRPYVAKLEARGGTGEGYLFRLVEGSLAMGLTLADNGSITGTPREIGTFAIAIEITDSKGASVRVPMKLLVGRSNWMTISSFPASSSSQALVSLANLNDSQTAITTLEDWAVGSGVFSPDGRLLSYMHRVSETANELFVVDVSSNTLGTPQSCGQLLERPSCVWSPDSTRLMCWNVGSTNRELLYFNTSQNSPGPRQSAPEVIASPSWVLEHSLVYADSSNQLRRLDLGAQSVGPSVSLGLSGAVGRISASRRHGLVHRSSTDTVPVKLVNFETGAQGNLPQHDELLFAKSFHAAVGIDKDPEIDAYNLSYYFLDDTTVRLVGARNSLTVGEAAHFRRAWAREEGDWFFELRDGQGVLVHITPSGVETRAIGGNYTNVGEVIAAARDGSALVFVADQVSETAQPQRSILLVRHTEGDKIDLQSLGPWQLDIGAVFSPDSRQLLVKTQAAESSSPMEMLLFELTHGAQLTPLRLDLPYDWAHTLWSDDSSYVSMVGGVYSISERPLYVVDALAPKSPPRKIISCSSNPAPLPGCPSSGVFQP